MEQNQNQVHVAVEEEELKGETVETSKEVEWGKIRNEFASNEESISQTEDVVALVEKWIWIQYEQEFKQYQKQLQQRSDLNRDLKKVIEDIIKQQRQASWIINQKYSMEQVNQLIIKLRQSIQEILTSERAINPEVQQINEMPQNNAAHNKYNAHANEAKAQRELLLNYSSMLPEIKPRGKIYNLKQMTSSFHLLDNEDYQIRSPYMFQSDKKLKQLPKESLFGSKYLKESFKWFCKQGYNSSGLFDDFSKESDKMSLNKWMVFCKQFDFIDRFHKKELISIYQTATKFASVMLLQDFLSAVSILQEKYVNKFHIGQYNFIGEVLKIGSQAAFKAKMGNLKVKYSGPRRNFFQYATYAEHERAEEIQKEKVFQAVKKQREIVLIKGMFEDHLKDEVHQLKVRREQNKMRLGNSLSMIQTKPKHMPDQTNSQMNSSRIQNLNYSKLFQINRGHTVKKDIKDTTTNTGLSNTNMYKTQLMKTDAKQKTSNKYIETRTMQNAHELKGLKHPNLSEAQKSKHQDKQDTTWLTKIRTDTEESDEILKEHLMIEEKIKNSKESSKINDLMQQMRQRSNNVEMMRQKIQKENAQDTDLIQTQINFKRHGQGMPA